jgi:hypothetical protein
MVRGRRARSSLLAAALATAVVAVTCGKSSSPPTLQVGGITGFHERAAGIANGPLPHPDAGLACGSTTEQFGTELLHTKPNNAHVVQEWGEIVPGQQTFVAGTVASIEFSSGDLTFDHPFGTDFTFDVKPDRPFARLVASVGTGQREGGPPGTLHMEISGGLLPHSDPTEYMAGFIPSVGDRVAAFGRWVVDCGHDDYHTEIHPTTFLAFGHRDGASTVVHTFYNPYYETQLYTPDPTLAPKLEDRSRLASKDSLTFPGYLFHQLLRVIHVGDPGPLGYLSRLEAHILLDANTASPVTWYQCAPGTKAGGPAQYSYDFVTRPGVSISAKPDPSTGCVGITATIGRSYRALDPQRMDCVDSWADLNAQAQAALGNKSVDILAAIQAQVPKSFRKLIAHNPETDCYDNLIGPNLAPVGSGRRVTASASQPFPFYGWVRVSH